MYVCMLSYVNNKYCFFTYYTARRPSRLRRRGSYR